MNDDNTLLADYSGVDFERIDPKDTPTGNAIIAYTGEDPIPLWSNWLNIEESKKEELNVWITSSEKGHTEVTPAGTVITVFVKNDPIYRESAWLNLVDFSTRDIKAWVTNSEIGHPIIKFSKNELEFNDLNECITQIKSLKIKLPHEQEIWEQLVRISQMAKPLSEACKLSRDEFPESELSLEMFFDPEGDDQYPILFIRQKTYENDIMSKIDNLMEKFDWFLEKNIGWFLITTDFKSIK